MSCILHIDTSTELCSVAVSENGAVIYHDESTDEHAHSSRLSLMIESAISFTDNHAIPFDAVSVSSGPGSYTGLRIGVSAAKGVCFGRNLKLISIPTLELLCVPLLLGRIELPDNALLCPMIDARRMEVYTNVYTRSLKSLETTSAQVVTSESFFDYLSSHPVYFFGNGSSKCKELLTHPNAHFLDGIRPHAKYMCPLAEKKHVKGEFSDVAYFEPFYLKDFIAGKPKTKKL